MCPSGRFYLVTGFPSRLHCCRVATSGLHQPFGRNMEKFCIVKRRKQAIRGPFPAPFPFQEEELGAPLNNFTPFKEIYSWKEPVLSISLTSDQSRAIRSGGILPFLEKEIPKSFILNLHQEDNGDMVFNFHLDLDHNVKMFKPHQVCRMMQISRNLLNRMIKENKIKSHKIGRLRRFNLKDILEALNQDLV
jgi:excisionase family DNA binding protein